MTQQVQFEVPGWLQFWWDIMVPITAALHWPAWAAVFTLAALWNVTRLANRSSQRDERKDAMTVLAGAQILATAVVPFESYLRKVDIGPVPMRQVEVINYMISNERMKERVDEFDQYKLPTAHTFGLYRQALLDLRILEVEIEFSIRDNEIPVTETMITAISEMHQRIGELRKAARLMLSKSDWERLHGRPSPYSLGALKSSLKSIPTKLRNRLARPLRSASAEKDG